MTNLYLKILSTFKSNETKRKFTDKGLPYIKHIDLYAGQDYNERAFEAHSYPALFISWAIDYTIVPPKAALEFRIAWEELRDTSSLSNDPGKALRYIEFVDMVDEVLKSIESDETSNFTLLNEKTNIEDTIVQTHSLNYTCTYTGKTKKSEIQKIPNPNFSLETML